MTDTVMEFPGTQDPDIIEQEDGQRVERASGQPFAISDDRQAAWAMRKLLGHREQVDQIVDVANAEIERIQQWAAGEVSKHQRDLDYFEALLTDYALRQRMLEDRKTITTPYGKVSTRVGQPKMVVSDEFIEWAQANHPEWIRTKVEADLSTFKSAVVIEETDGGLAAVTEDGDIVPGVTVEAAQVTATVGVGK